MFFKRTLNLMTKHNKPIDPSWQRNAATDKFPRLLRMDPEEMGLKGKSGVFVIWHGGVRPSWVYVGQSRDLARDLTWCADNDDIRFFETFGGLFCSWTFIRKEYQAGAVKFLTDFTKPEVANPLAPGKAVDPIAILLPGAKAE